MISVILSLSIISMYYHSTLYQDYSDTQYNHKTASQTYQLNKAKQRWDLPKELEEISGLSFYERNKLACIQDEEGKLFIYDLKKKEIHRQEHFGEKGDYEGIEILYDTAYVLRSDGDVFYFGIDKNGIGEVNKIKTDLRKKNDAEGLGYLSQMNEAIVACKEDPGTKKVNIEKSRSIYRITIHDKKFKKKPRFIIDGKAYNKKLEEKDLNKKKHKPFKPSGVAVHPKSGEVYVIGTVGKMMIVLTPEGEISDLIPLNPKLFVQPEGICFNPQGDLFISSEGRGKKGYILKF